MSLMTGERRSATVIAHSDCECYRLDKGEFAAILQARPALAEDISRVLEARRRDQDSARAAATTHATPATDTDLLARIRGFFGL
jgi:CRP-like cAMP-binding protein